MTPWIVAHQAPLSMGFPRQDYWSGLPFPSPGDLPNPGIKPASPALASTESLLLSHQEHPIIHVTDNTWRNRDVKEWHIVPQQICSRARVWTWPSVLSICTLEHFICSFSNLWRQKTIIKFLTIIMTTEIISLYSDLWNPIGIL